MATLWDSSNNLPVSIQNMWDAQHTDPECQIIYQDILEKGGVQENNNTFSNNNTTFTILEDLISQVVKLP